MVLFLVRLKVSNNSKMIATLNKSIKNPVLFNYSFVFSKFNDEFELFTNDFKQFNVWKQALSLLLIQNTFHEDFTVIKMIGKGSFAKVYLAKKKENNTCYAIKAFNKDFLNHNTNKGKVMIFTIFLIMFFMVFGYIFIIYIRYFLYLMYFLCKIGFFNQRDISYQASEPSKHNKDLRDLRNNPFNLPSLRLDNRW